MEWECDCMVCEFERAEADLGRKDEARMSKQLTCTCGSRYVRDADHEGDCDLWLIDEFWAGFLAWDWDREVLVPTDMYPPGHECDYVGNVEEYEWDEEDLVQRRLGEMESRSDDGFGPVMSDEDLALTTDAFIERMLTNNVNGVTDDGQWTKTEQGLWKRTDPATGQTTYRTSQSVTYPYHDSDDWDGLSAGYSYGGGTGGYNWATSDRHASHPCVFPDGTTVYGTSLSKKTDPDRKDPDYALYVDMGWVPSSMAVMLPWQDYGLPRVSFKFADYAIKEAFSWAQAGAIVEVGCIGAHGRTGTVLACMAVLADPKMTATEAVTYVRTVYCHHAIETREQEWFVARFRAELLGEDEPERPVYKPAPARIVGAEIPKATPSMTTASHSGGAVGDPNKPGRRRRARRSKRGGKRNRSRSMR